MHALTYRSFRMILAGSVAFGLAAGAASASIVPFHDNFATGGDFDSDEIEDFWTWQDNPNDPDKTTEMWTEDGRLHTRMQGQHNDGTGVAGVTANSTQSWFNFTEETLILQIDDLDWAGTSAPDSGAIIRGGFASEQGGIWGTDTGVTFQFRKDGRLELGWGVGGDSPAWRENLLAEIDSSGDFSGDPRSFELTLGPDAWAVRMESDNDSFEASGSEDFANAGFPNNGDMYLAYEPFHSNSGFNTVRISSDRISVIPEPGSLGLLGLGGLLMLARRRR